MLHNLADFVVQVFATFPDKTTNLGTAYPVGENRLLTALHVVKKGDVLAETIEVRWFVGDEKRGTGWLRATILSHGAEKLDLGVLESTFPVDAKIPLPKCVGFQPQGTEAWKSWGYPKAGETKEGFREIISVGGRTHSGQSWDQEIDLGVDYAVDGPANWGGISGAPVFVGDNLIGVIVKCPGRFDGGRLVAASVKQALECPVFESHISVFNSALYFNEWQRERDNLINALQNNQNYSYLLEAYYPDNFAKLFDKSMLKFMIIMENFCEELERRRVEGFDKFIPELCRCVFSVVNTLVKIEVIREIAKQKIGKNSNVISVVARATMAEIVMSAVDRRPLKFKEWDVEADQIGEYALPRPPILALDSDISNAAVLIDEDIIKMLCIDVGDTRQRKIEIAAELFEAAAQRKKSKYTILDGNNVGVRERSEKLAKILKQKYPALAIFCRGNHEYASDEIALPAVIASLYNFKERYSR